MALDLYSISLIAIVVVLAGVIGIRLNITSAIIEVIAGIILGNFLGVRIESWFDFLSTFGGLMLTFLAGVEIDLSLLKRNGKQSFVLGSSAFIVTFVGEMTFLYLVTDWSLPAMLTASLAQTPTAIAVVYTMFLECGLLGSQSSRLILAAIFVNDILTLMCINLIAHNFNSFTVAFILAMVAVALALPEIMRYIAEKHGMRSVELELRFIFAIILGISFLAEAGNMQAVFGAFLLGLVFANSLHNHLDILSKLRSVTFSLLSPMFFIRAGILISLPAVIENTVLILGILAVKMLSKSAGTYYFNRLWVPEAPIFATVLFSSSLTVGIVTASFGRNSQFLDQTQFSIVMIAIVLSAIIPTLIARRFVPVKC
jgi:glutathione-regulated potassium-efflux system ancillary protein KefC